MIQGLIRRIGNGANTNIWEDNWLPREELIWPYGCMAANPHEVVSDLIDLTSATWNKEKLEATFMHFDVKVILSIPLCTMNMQDFWGWAHEKSGKFSVRSAYRMLVSTRQRREA